jgi:formate hydrogenlyase subunit 3/multisubunit Na+/H+ antiporter MnhD subunit
MDASLAAWIVLAVAFAAANLPFASERVFGFIPWPAGQGASPAGQARNKPFVARLLELLVLYFLVGAFAWLLESRIGNVFAQRWEFYTVTGCMFLVLAFPGFVFRYLRKRRSQGA